MNAGTNSSNADTASILIVEDDAMLGAQINAVLLDLRFTVAGVASSLQEALSILEISRPQLALVDARLPGPVGGDEIAAMLRHRGIPTIILTGTPEEPEEVEAEAAPPPGSAVMPFRPSSAFRAISSALAEASDNAPCRRRS
jgi:two-component system, response regulator PdtaR